MDYIHYCIASHDSGGGGGGGGGKSGNNGRLQGACRTYPFEPKAMAFTSPEDLMKKADGIHLPEDIINITGCPDG